MYFHRIKDLDVVTPMLGAEVKSVFLEKLMITFMEFQPGVLIKPHSHPHEQISIIIRGKAIFCVDGESRLLEAGDVCVIPSNVEHSAEILDEHTTIYDGWSPPRDDYAVT